jgi:hypothetical protein
VCLSTNIRLGVIRQSISRVLREAELGSTELKRLQSEGRTADAAPETQKVLESIRNTAMFDLNDEHETLAQKHAGGPVNDPDAKGPPNANARFIVEWLASDLTHLDPLIRKLRDSGQGDHTLSTRADFTPLVTLLETVGTEMLKAQSARRTVR